MMFTFENLKSEALTLTQCAIKQSLSCWTTWACRFLLHAHVLSRPSFSLSLPSNIQAERQELEALIPKGMTELTKQQIRYLLQVGACSSLSEWKCLEYVPLGIRLK